jgi:hypothetical protein
VHGTFLFPSTVSGCEQRQSLPAQVSAPEFAPLSKNSFPFIVPSRPLESCCEIEHNERLPPTPKGEDLSFPGLNL